MSMGMDGGAGSRLRAYAAAAGAVWVVSVGFAGCARGPALPEPLGPVPETARLYYDDGGGLADSARLVIRGEAMWQDVWQRATAQRPAPPPLPVIDFDRDMILVVAAGRMTPEDQIRVDSVGVRRERTADGEDRDALTVIVRTTQGCGRFASEAYPVEIVRVRRFDGPVSFVERRERAECGGVGDR
ncbi:MAG TPA: hypothetical protein VMM12_06165 [Longimicrobiales bacterium]|nr:hypothetical protein [Longimicrobiales bacterium]